MAFYESIAPWYDQIFPFIQGQKRFIDQELETVAGKQILDVGCGTGNLALSMAASGAIVTGIDVDEQMLSIALQKGQFEDRASFLRLNMLKVQEVFPSNSLDAVVCFGNTLVHLQKPGEILFFFNQVCRLLNPSGKLMLQIINYDYILDQGLDGLPVIDNEQITFERLYEFREQDELINFKTILTVKSTGQVIRNSVPLLPIRRDLLYHLLNEAGYNQIDFYGSFDRSTMIKETFPLIVTAAK
jgi:2-polyprenyl-3-methyl-5-hydroxy-6-metoxy-1,4-benzoquinol methylase